MGPVWRITRAFRATCANAHKVGLATDAKLRQLPALGPAQTFASMVVSAMIDRMDSASIATALSAGMERRVKRKLARRVFSQQHNRRNACVRQLLWTKIYLLLT